MRGLEATRQTAQAKYLAAIAEVETQKACLEEAQKDLHDTRRALDDFSADYAALVEAQNNLLGDDDESTQDPPTTE